MKERPTLFSGLMVQAILDGRKTITRRPIKPQPPKQAWWVDRKWLAAARMQADMEHFRKPDPFDYALGGRVVPQPRCPYGVPGDELWVRETWQLRDWWKESGQTSVNDSNEMHVVRIRYPSDTTILDYHMLGKYMPRNLRKNLRTSRPSIHMPRWASRIQLIITSIRAERLQEITKQEAKREGFNGVAFFLAAWDSMYSKRPRFWSDASPWVWRIQFERKT